MNHEYINKPIIVFDLETTGLNKSKDSIIQFSAIKTDIVTGQIHEELDLKIRPEQDYEISLGAYFKHNISKEDLEKCPTFREVADQIRNFFDGDYIILTYNGLSFDLSFLAIEFERIGQEFTLIDKVCYDAFLEEKRREDLTLEGRYKHYYGESMEESGLKAHDALSDVKATFKVFLAQQEEYQTKPEEVLTECNTIKMMDFRGKELPCFMVGKYRTIPIQIVYKIDPQYLGWILSPNCSFSPSCKKFVKKYLDSVLS